MRDELNAAVILAAGMGTRLRDIIGEKPKGFLELEGKELILHSIEKLKSLGINNILLVTGYQENFYVECLQEIHPGVQFLTNQDYSITGSMHSLFLAKSKVRSDFLLLESDIYFENRALSSLLNFERSDGVLISGKTGSGDEVYVYGENEQINHISKKQLREKKVQGELVGISKISYKLFGEMCDYYSDNISFPSNYHYEDCFSDISKGRRLDYLKIEDLAWTEIDDHTHYRRAVDKIVPKVRENNLKFNELKSQTIAVGP